MKLRTIKFLLCLLLLILLYTTISSSFSSIIVERVSKEAFTRNLDLDLDLDLDRMTDFQKRVDLAIKLSPYNTKLYTLKADLMMEKLKVVGEGTREDRDSIIQTYNKAISLEPTSTLLRAKYATFASKVNNLDLTFQNMKAAIELGKYEKNTINLITPLIFKHWDSINNTNDLRGLSVNLLSWCLSEKSAEATLAIRQAALFENQRLLELTSNKKWVLNRYKYLVKKNQSTSSGKNQN